MRPSDLSDRLEEVKRALDQLPVRLQQEAQQSVDRPPGTSVLVQQAPKGVRVAATGPYAKEVLHNAGVRLRRSTQDMIQEASR